jgi:hypothetical protein
MSSEENKTRVRRFSNVWNTGNLDDLDDVLAPDFVAHGSSADTTGIEGWKQFVRNLSAGKDVHATVDELIADGDWVAERWSVRATDTATGEQTTWQGMTLHRFANGKLQEDWAVAEARPTRE